MRNEFTPTPAPMPTRMQIVMFDPLAYIHPERLPLPMSMSAGFDAPAQRAAINTMLLDRYRLSAEPVPQRQAEAAKLLLRYWFRLPQIAFLLGCQRLRLALSRRGLLLRLPAQAQLFMTLPLLCNAGLDACKQAVLRCLESDSGRGPDHDTLLRHGVRQLHLSLGGMPDALAQRLPLLLAPSFDAAADSGGAVRADGVADRTPEDALILTMAIRHVEKYSAAA